MGCVPDGVYQRGPKKGRPRFDHPVPGTTRHICVLTSEMIEHAKEYERSTMQCWDCKGLARVIVAWSRDGKKFAHCPRCAGLGLITSARFAELHPETPCT